MLKRSKRGKIDSHFTPNCVYTLTHVLQVPLRVRDKQHDRFLAPLCLVPHTKRWGIYIAANLHLTTAHYRRISGSLQTHYRRTIDALQTQNLIDAIFENAYRHIIAAVLPQHRRNIDALQPHQRRNQTLYSSTKATILKQYRRSIDAVQQQHSRIINSSRFFQTQFFYRRT